MKPSALMVMITSVFGTASCTGVGPQTSHVTTILAQSEVGRKLALLDKEFTPSAICADFDLVNELLEYIQPLSAPVIGNRSCPQTFSGLADYTAKAIANQHDLHAGVEFGHGLDAVVNPVVHDCSGDQEICSAISGAPILAVPGAVDGHLYSAIPRDGANAYAFEVLSVNGNSYDDVLREALESQSISHFKPGVIPLLSTYLFSRSVFDHRDHGPIEVTMRRLADNSEFHITGSFEDRQQIFPEATLRNTLSADNVRRNYGCLPGTNYSAATGGCLTQSQLLVLWIDSWQDQAGASLLDTVSANLQKLGKSSGASVILDLRENVGGDPRTAVEFLCTFGDDANLSEMANRGYLVDQWPQTFNTSGGQIQASSFKVSANLDIRKIIEGWSVTSDSIQSQHKLTIGLLARFGLTPQSCRAMRSQSFAGLKWLVVDDGTEMSTSELFLSVAKASDRFRILGRRTRGATGSPIMISLPNTSINVMLSQAREISISSGAEVVDRVGVPASMESAIDTREEFEAAARLSFEGVPEVDPMPQYVVRRALEFCKAWDRR